MKLVFAKLNQGCPGSLDLLGDDGLRYDDWTMTRPSPRTSSARTPASGTCAFQGQLDRGRHLRGAAQHRGRADPRPAHRAPRRQGPPLERPPAMTMTAPADVDLLRRRRARPALLGAQGAGQARHTRPAERALRRPRRGDRPALVGLRQLGCPGCWRPESLGGAGELAREGAAVPGDRPRGRALPVPDVERHCDVRARRTRRRDHSSVARER